MDQNVRVCVCFPQTNNRTNQIRVCPARPPSGLALGTQPQAPQPTFATAHARWHLSRKQIVLIRGGTCDIDWAFWSTTVSRPSTRCLSTNAYFNDLRQAQLQLTVPPPPPTTRYIFFWFLLFVHGQMGPFEHHSFNPHAREPGGAPSPPPQMDSRPADLGRIAGRVQQASR